MSIRITFTNVGIDNWNLDQRELLEKPVPVLTSIEGLLNPQNSIPLGRALPTVTKRVYSCYSGNENIKAVANKMVKDIVLQTNADLYIFSEFCLFSYDSIKQYMKTSFLQFYGPAFPTELDPVEKESSKKMFLTFSKTDKVVIKPLEKENLVNLRSYNDGTNISDISLKYGNYLQVNSAVINGVELIIGNFHSRSENTYNLLRSIFSFIMDYRDYKNVLICGDFNRFVTKAQNEWNRKKIRFENDIINSQQFSELMSYAQYNEFNLNMMYDWINSCPDKNKKSPNLKIFYKLQDFSLKHDSEHPKCTIDFNISSHIVVNFILTNQLQYTYNEYWKYSKIIMPKEYIILQLLNSFKKELDAHDIDIFKGLLDELNYIIRERDRIKYIVDKVLKYFNGSIQTYFEYVNLCNDQSRSINISPELCYDIRTIENFNNIFNNKYVDRPNKRQRIIN